MLGDNSLEEFWGSEDDATAASARKAITTSRARNDARLEELYD